MQVSPVVSVFYSTFIGLLFLPLVACASEGGLPDDIMTEAQTPVAATPAPKKSEAAKTEETKPTKKSTTESADKSSDKTSGSKASPKIETAKSSIGVDSAEIKKLKDLDLRYQNAKSISMDVERNLIMGLLGKEKKAKGTLLLSKGRMRMEFNEPDRSLVVIDGKTLWVADYPPKEFKNAAIQVLKGKVSSKKGASQGFVGLLTRGGVLSQFQVTGAQADKEGRTVYFLTPKQATVEFKRAELALSKDGKTIQELRFWDERDNETKMYFSNVKFDQPVNAKTFEFTPPENADVTTL